jgi:hypothetical protein
LVSLVAAGRRTREETLEYFRHLFHTAQAEQDSFFWPALILRSTDLYPDVVTQEIREAFDKQDIDPFLVSLKDVEATLAQGKDHTLEELSRSGYYKWVEDTVRETEWWACFQPPAPPPRIAASSPARGAAPISAPARPWAQTRPPVHLGPKPGRNAPCPCGSGLKYKKCCLKKSTA